MSDLPVLVINNNKNNYNNISCLSLTYKIASHFRTNTVSNIKLMQFNF